MSTQPSEPKQATETTYVILMQEPQRLSENVSSSRPADTWNRVGQFDARSSEAAVRKYAEKAKDFTKAEGSIVIVAVPARSWQPVKVTPKVETTLVIEGVKA